MPAAAGATQIPVAPLSASLPAGAVLNFAQTKAVLIAEAPAGATFLKVQALGAALPSGAQISWSGEMLVRSQFLTRIALAQPLSSAIPEGAVLAFPSGNVVLAQEAAAGAIYLYAHPVEQPTVGAIATYAQELFQLPYRLKQLVSGGTRTGGNVRLYPYSLTKPALTMTVGSRCGGIIELTLTGGTRSGGISAKQIILGTKSGGFIT